MHLTGLRSTQPLFFLMLFCGLLFIGTRIDTDDWFLLACGRYVEQSGIPHTEPLSMFDGWDYVMQQWLAAFGLWELYNAFGVWGLIGYAHVVGAVIIFLYDRLVHLTAGGGDTSTVEFLLVFPIGALLSVMFFVPRPQVLSMMFCLAEVYLLERYRTTRPRWLFALLPMMSALLVNIHAALWPMFLVLALPYLAEALFGTRLAARLPHDSRWQPEELLALLALSFCAGFLNPYGLDAMRYSTLSYSIPGLRGTVSELLPLSLGDDVGLFLGGLVFLIYFGLSAAYARHPLPLRQLLLAAGTGFMGLLSIRSLFFFLIFATFPLARILRGWRFPEAAWTTQRKVLVTLLVLANVTFFALRVLPMRYTVPPYPPQGVAAVDALARMMEEEGRAPQETKVYTGFTVGNYVAFRGFRVYFDARPEVFMSVLNHHDDIYKEYIDMQKGRAPYRDVIGKYPFDALLVRRDDILWVYLPEDAEYTCVWDSEEAGIAGDPADDMRIYRKR